MTTQAGYERAFHKRGGGEAEALVVAMMRDSDGDTRAALVMLARRLDEHLATCPNVAPPIPRQMFDRLSEQTDREQWEREQFDSEREAHNAPFADYRAGDAALRAFTPTSRTEQAQVDRYEATR